MTPRTILLLLAVAIGFILYGSLHPFAFNPLPSGAGPFAAAAEAWPVVRANRGDVLANLLLYLPVGLLLAALLPGRAGAQLALAGLVALVLSTGIELLQLYDRGRTSSPWDVLCNTIGAVAGATLVILGASRQLGRKPRIEEPLAALLVLAWLAYRLFPYLPSIDLQAWRDNLKPLLLHPVLEPGRTVWLFACWTAAALLAQAALGRMVARWAVPLGLSLGVAAEVVIPGKALTPAEAFAPILAWAAWTVLRGRRRTAPLIATALITAVLAERLEPFVFAFPTREFGWIPFRSLLGGSREAAVAAILLKLFLYGALLWWLLRSGLRLPVATGLAVPIVLGASLLQTVIPGRSAEITDTLMVLGLAVIFHLAKAAVGVSRAEATWRSRAARRQATSERRGRGRRSRAGLQPPSPSVSPKAAE